MRWGACEPPCTHMHASKITSLFLSHEFGEGLSLWKKLQCQPVVAIALPGGLWAIIKDMPLMTTAACAVVLSARQNQLKVFFNADAVGGYRLPKAWPASATVVLSSRREQGKVTASARIRARSLFFVERAGTRGLGGIIAQHLKTIVRQQCAPLRFRQLQWESIFASASAAGCQRHCRSHAK